jgi:hypothetical protein
MRGAILTGALAVIAFDALGASFARDAGLDFQSIAPISLFLYALTGFLASRRGAVFDGILAGAIVAFIDGTLGWGIGSGLAPSQIAPDTTIAAAMLLAAMGAMCGFAGGMLGKLLPSTADILW